ncbi:MAG: DNA primase [Prevotella sp.]|jgi:hypothetical protein|nr:DNA primase [Prevotella sp.]
MYISPSNKERILKASEGKYLEVIGDYIALSPADKAGKTHIGQCPACNAANGLLVTPSKNRFGCCKCKNFGGTKPIDFLMKKGMPFNDALEDLARILNIVIYDDTPVPARTDKKEKPKAKNTFLDKFLSGSGLTPQDVEAKVDFRDANRTITTGKVFKKGTLNQFDNEDLNGDDVLIEYYDLEGLPVKYDVLDAKKRPTGKQKAYVRVRYQYPDEHRDSKSHPIKYKTPRGAGTHLYIPQKIREIYQNKEKIIRLFVQEGEKKAEKCCKHGIPSVGISGIQNLGTNGQIPPDLVKIIQRCKVEELILLFDSDWDELSSNLSINEDVQKRPRNFFYAALNFQSYVRTLKNRDICLRIFIGHVRKNEACDKGIDDLMVNTLQGREQELTEDISTLVNKKKYDGKYLQLYNITIMGEYKLRELWALDNAASFAERHKDVLKDMPEFKIGQHQWRFTEEGKLENTRPIEPDERYWSEYPDTKKNKTAYEFAYVNSINFLQNRGFGRYRRLDGTWQFIHLTPPTVKVVDSYEARDFITEFTKAMRLKEVLELLYRGGSQYLGPDRLSNLAYLTPKFAEPQRNEQIFYFKDVCWKVTKKDIKITDYTEVNHTIWADQLKTFEPQRVDQPLISVSRNENGKFEYSLSKYGQVCHMLQFLINTSNFTWKKAQQNMPIDPDEIQENKDHLISKLCAIGYMLMSCKDRNVSRAVVAMDGKQSEVGKSNGRSGKSIIGEMFKHILPTIAINGKAKDIEGDTFVWTELTEKTKIVFIDDVRTNFSLEFLFACITGDWTVNYKGGGRITFPFSQSPKLYITTNHALNGEGASFMDRQWLIAFSDFYNDKHKPLDDFGMLFFDEWEFDQWNLLWNLMAECVQLYLKFGVVQSPGERLESRRMRQSMGENFILWAEEYFSDGSDHLNKRIPRKEMYDDFFDKSAIKDRKYITPTSFKEKIKLFCEWKNYIFNPNKYDPVSQLPLKYDPKSGDAITDDKSGGVEWFTVGEPSMFWKTGISLTDNKDNEQKKYKI